MELDLFHQLTKPSNHFGDCETAHMFMCEGCPEEHGWSAASEIPEPETDVCCEWMSFADFDMPVCVRLADDKIACIGRIALALEEYRKYLEVMV